MPKLVKPLSVFAINKLEAKPKQFSLSDGQVVGLSILVLPNGTKSWRLKYTLNGKEKRASLGTFPTVTLAEAREAASSIKDQIRSGVDPAQKSTHTFAESAERFIEWKESVLLRAGATIRKYRECLKNDLLPAFGDRDIADIHAIDVVPVLERINKRSNSLAMKNLELVSMIVKYSIQQGYRPAYTQIDLSGVIVDKPRVPKIIPKDIPAAYRRIDSYAGLLIKYAMKMQFLCFLRPSETIGGAWDEFDFVKKEWHIEPKRMKMKLPHVVPLADQTLAILQDLQKITGNTPYLFPSKHNESSMHRDSISRAFREAKLGIVPHGCRTAASTWLKNNRYRRELVETQLSHLEGNKVAAAYHDQPHMMYLDERVAMMQAWANHLTTVQQS